MRLLHVIKSADPAGGGPIEGAVRTAEALQRLGHQQDLFTLDSEDADFLPRYPGTIHNCGSGAPGRLPWHRYGYAPGAIAALRNMAPGYDAVIVAGLWNYSTFAARFGLADRSTPYFVYTHGMLDPWFLQGRPIKHLIKQLSWLVNEGPLLRDADAVLFTAEDERTLADRVFRPYRLRPAIAGYGTADAPEDSEAHREAFFAACPMLRERPFLLFLSRVHPKKGCDLLIEAFARIAPEEDIDLVVAGPGDPAYLDQLRQLAAAQGVGERVHFVGMLRDAVKWGAFRACEAFALSSHQENFGVAVVEALACARPVLITNKINIWREIESDGAGLVFDDRLDAVADGLARFHRMSSEQRAAMGDRARACFLERYRIDSSTERLVEIIASHVRARA